MRPPAIVPNVSAIIPRNRLALDGACCALQRVVWNIGIENCHVTFDAINNVSFHGTIPHKPLVPPAIILRNTRPDESKWQEDAAEHQISAGPNVAGGYDWRMRMPKQFSTKSSHAT